MAYNNGLNKQDEKYTIVYVFTSCKRSGPIHAMYSIIQNLDRSTFNPILVTLYDEIEGESELGSFLQLNVEHIKVPTSKAQIIFNRTQKLERILRDLKPSIIHSLGVFPDFAISRMRLKGHVMTLHNYMYEDFPSKYGNLRGAILVSMQVYALKNAEKVWTCSKSLAEMYKDSMGIEFDYIRNGVDLSRFAKIDKKDKAIGREQLSLPRDSIIFIYSGQFIGRKNQQFLLDLFTSDQTLMKYTLLLLGDGVNYLRLKKNYAEYSNVVFAGNVKNVGEYLSVSDYYISCSKSEGLPIGVLEAMSCGLPVVLSDIKQHSELFQIDNNMIGTLYKTDCKDDCREAIKKITNEDYEKMSSAAFHCVHEYLSAEEMSREYQDSYLSVINNC